MHTQIDSVQCSKIECSRQVSTVQSSSSRRVLLLHAWAGVSVQVHKRTANDSSTIYSSTVVVS
jgi:hypothetical protein